MKTFAYFKELVEMLKDRERIMCKLKIKRKSHRTLYSRMRSVQFIIQIGAFYSQFGLGGKNTYL
jgi:hypothetical protein